MSADALLKPISGSDKQKLQRDEHSYNLSIPFLRADDYKALASFAVIMETLQLIDSA
jgi:hypothetical protein